MKKQKFLHPIDGTDKEELVEKMRVGKRPFYSLDLTRDADTDEEKTVSAQADIQEPDESTKEFDEDTVGSSAGTPGHPGFDHEAT